MNKTNEEVRARFEEFVAHQVNDKAIPSISYVLLDQNGAFAMGHVQPDGVKKTIDDNSVFRIGSLTKMFTTLSLMQLEEQGLVDIDADVSTYIPHFKPHNPFADAPSGPLGSQVSLRKLMSHTSGLTREPKSGHYLDAFRPPLADTVDELADSTLKEDPSIGIFRYSNAGIAVVGSVIERLSGKSYPDYVREHIFEPVGMANTSAILTPEIDARLAPASMWTIDGDVPAPVFGLGGSPAGNIFSTAPDMALFGAMLLRGGFCADGTQIVRPDTLTQMWQVAGLRPAGYRGLKGYGFGFGVGTVDGWMSVGHSGAVYGYATHMTLLPHAGIGALVFSTLDFTNQIAGQLVIRGLEIALADRKMGEMPARPDPVRSASPEEMARRVGHYVSVKGDESVDIRIGNGRLYLMGDGMPLEIRPVGDTQYIVDGRIHSDGTDYAHRDVAFSASGEMTWKNVTWQRKDPDTTPPPADLAPYLGEYGPDFNITYLFFADGKLKCLIEYFSTHDCEPLGDNRFRMHGLLYEDETLELDATDENGAKGIRVGPMFLARRA